MGDWLMLAAVILPLVFILVVIVYVPNDSMGGYVKPGIVLGTFLLYLMLSYGGAELIRVPDRFSGLEEPRYSQMDALVLSVVVLIIGWAIRGAKRESK